MQSLATTGDPTSGNDLYDPARVAYNRRGLWIAGVILLLGLLAFVALFNFILPPFEAQLSGPALVGVGLILSLIPAGIWLIFFYRFDRIEPEPKQRVFAIFVGAALVMVAIGRPILVGVYEIDSWLYDTWWTHLFGGILVVGLLQSFLIYLVIRYGIYFNPEFDERVDGIIYGTAAGLGMATILNFSYILAHGGVDLDVGSMRMVINALAFASFGGILGYFLGQTRFEKTPFYYLPAGVALAAVLNGVFFFLEDRVTATGLQSNPRNGLIMATIFAVLIMGLLFWLINRANAETLRIAAQMQGIQKAPTEVSSPTGTGITDEISEAGGSLGDSKEIDAGVTSSQGAGYDTAGGVEIGNSDTTESTENDEKEA